VSDQRPRHFVPSGVTYLDAMCVAVSLEFAGAVDPDSLDRDALVSAQVRVNERQAAKWMVSTLRRCYESSWGGDRHMLLGLHLDPDLPRTYPSTDVRRRTYPSGDMPREDD